MNNTTIKCNERRLLRGVVHIKKAIVSGHIWIDEKEEKDIEILNQVDDDFEVTEIFCDIDLALLDNIKTGDSKDYYFIALVKSQFVEYKYWEGSEWEAEHEVIEIKSIDDIGIHFL